MGIRSPKEIYQVLEKVLKEVTDPVTCVDLMDRPDIRQSALAEYGKDVRIATNKVSDALGLMWRRNLLKKYPAPAGNTLAKYSYIWDHGRDSKPVQLIPPVSPSRKVGVNITEQDGGVFIEFDKFTVFIKQK